MNNIGFLLSRINGIEHPAPLLGAEIDLLVLYIKQLEEAGNKLAEEAESHASLLSMDYDSTTDTEDLMAAVNAWKEARS